MKTIIYFSSHNEYKSEKFNILKEEFVSCNLIFFVQTFNFENDTKKIESLVEQYSEDLIFMGFSLGAVPGLYSAFKYDKEILLINPDYFPEITSRDIFNDEQLNELDKFKKSTFEILFKNKRKKLIDLFLSKLDDKIDENTRKRFFALFNTYVANTTVDNITEHSYPILKDRLTTFRIGIYKHEIDIEDLFQMCENNIINDMIKNDF